ncbi:cupin [Streptomyces sp. AJS327]|uniref:cupin n=1 Tax=Streptomyces sp. AJS327 TaxID=2545265 RepID=UPI0015DFE443|nr:cupin [Streptomyces sp. AJS327]MBA0049927.1 cupin [Streptomyces sp. AJS327]
MDDLTSLADEHLTRARSDPHGRSAQLFLHDGPLRQSVIALTAGAALDEHGAPPAASLLVLRGRALLTTEDREQELSAGHIQRVPQLRHGLLAVDDTVVLLTTVTGG